MKNKIEEMKRRTISVMTILSFLVYFISVNAAPELIAEAATKEKEEDYIVITQSEKQAKTIEKTYGNSEAVNENGEDFAEEHHMAAVKLTGKELYRLKKDDRVSLAEEDLIMEASTEKSSEADAEVMEEDNSQQSYHEKTEEIIEENTDKDEWNIQMIHADKVEGYIKNKKKEKVKIAILDSGVCFGNDIDVEKTISLVPGEEEMSPLFMDGTGHGDSVAGLIAAMDNDEGITGINPDAEIYSIRVLDDDNCAPVSRVIEGIYQAMDWDVNIINMSFGISKYSAALDKAVQDAEDAGILVVAAAGNTGNCYDGENSTVQYPAALDEVIAVGSVDQHGDVTESSAKGEEVELVAPGELVRSTDFFGSNVVESGTSLAAPQITAVASLIWEKDLTMPAEFVRALLKESANAYGEQDKYGNGLVDAEYALKYYDSFKKKYEKEKNDESVSLPENTKDIKSFDDTGCVKGSWKVKDHLYKDMIPANRTYVRKGARFPDETVGFKYMTQNPWWHGYHKFNKSPVNYVGAYIYIARIANNYGNNLDYIQIPNGFNYAYAVKEDIRNIVSWSSVLDASVTNGRKRAFIWGLAIHSLSDAFAHSTYQRDGSGWKSICHNQDGVTDYADQTGNVRARYWLACEAVSKSLQKSLQDYTEEKSASYTAFEPAKKAISSQYKEVDQFKMADIYTFVKDVAGVAAAAPFADVSERPNYAVK